MNNWTEWKPMPSPENCRKIEGPKGAGVYQIRDVNTHDFIQFGIGTKCQNRMKSFFPKPFGTGNRNNMKKREFIWEHWEHLEYRTWETDSIEEARQIENTIKAENNHLFNT